MAFKVIILCAFAVMIQSIAGQPCRSVSISAPSPSSCGCSSITVSNNGGPLSVTSVGPIAPSGIALATELGLAGNLDVSGALPYLSAVAFEGQFPTCGTAPVSYGCGDCVAITQEISGSPVSYSSISGCGCGR